MTEDPLTRLLGLVAEGYEVAFYRYEHFRGVVVQVDVGTLHLRLLMDPESPPAVMGLVDVIERKFGEALAKEVRR